MTTPSSYQGKGKPHLPVAVQVGFAGARALVDRKQHPTLSEPRLSHFEAALTEELADILREKLVGPMSSQGRQDSSLPTGS